MTATVDHTRDHDLTVQGSQAGRARALHHLIEDHDLPTISNWSIDSATNSLVGTVWAELGETADHQKAKIRRWAEYLQAEITETLASGRAELSAEGWAHGVRVRINAPLRAELPKAVA